MGKQIFKNKRALYDHIGKGSHVSKSKIKIKAQEYHPYIIERCYVPKIIKTDEDQENFIQWLGLALVLMIDRDQIERMVQTRQTLNMVLNDFTKNLKYKILVVVASHDVTYQT